MPKDDDGMLDKLDGRVERVEVLDMINRIYRIEKWIGWRGRWNDGAMRRGRVVFGRGG